LLIVPLKVNFAESIFCDDCTTV